MYAIFQSNYEKSNIADNLKSAPGLIKQGWCARTSLAVASYRACRRRGVDVVDMTITAEARAERARCFPPRQAEAAPREHSHVLRLSPREQLQTRWQRQQFYYS